MTLTYGVRQHGGQLLDDLAGRAEPGAGADAVQAAATPASEPGHYSATLTLPHASQR